MSARTMVALAEEYLAHRRGLGFALRSEGHYLLTFARFADADGHSGPITSELVVRWATQPGPRPRRFPARRLDAVRPFARYRAAFEPATEVPTRGLLGPARRRPVHHIYSPAEVATLIAGARALGPPKGLRPVTYATLFGLLASSGLRVSEALRLTRADADLAAGVLTIRATKFHKSRLVPLHPTTTAALRAYANRRDRAVSGPAAPTFFVSARGAALPYMTVRTVFGRLRTSLGWDALAPRPRIHDLRHTFACRRLERWYDAGVEVAPRVAALATYLGHAKVSDTYWYLTGTPELLALAARRFEAFGETAGGAR
ncbi:MAG: tyrosine-type recombinase/integrase [Deltaproteobacteria bacterium]|nr:tyrosine-type recombinase/integrase [Deltaproteobacteria bacterium]